MSLLKQYESECVLYTKSRTADGLGGYKTVYTEGASFFPAWEYESSAEMLVAEQQGTKRTYRIYVDKSLDLDYHETFKRLSDNQVFRVTNDGTDRETPAMSRLNKRLVEVEKYELPTVVVPTEVNGNGEHS